MGLSISYTGLSPAAADLSRSFYYRRTQLYKSYNPGAAWTPVWADPRSLATTNGIISFPRVTKMFQFTRFPLLDYFVHLTVTGYRPLLGFPIQISPDIAVIHTSPGLFAVYHVFLRRLLPGHPPCTLTSLLN